MATKNPYDRAGGVTQGTLVKKAKPANNYKPNRDLTRPGAGEAAFAEHGDKLFQTGKGEQFYDQTKGAYNKPGAGENVAKDVGGKLTEGAKGESVGQQYWEGVSGRYQAGGPGYTSEVHKSFGPNVDPNLDSYYDRAFEKGSRRLDRSAAARGMYGSSESLRNVGEFAADLGAQQANREADYALQRQDALMRSAQVASGDELGWTQGLGSLAFGAGSEGLGYAGAAIDAGATEQTLGQGRLAQGQNAAQSIDAYNVGAIQAGLDAAHQAQGAREGRLQTWFGNELALGDRYAGYYGNALDRDSEMGQNQIGTNMGQQTEQFQGEMGSVNADYNQWQNDMATLAASASPASSFGGGGMPSMPVGGGGGGGGGKPAGGGGQIYNEEQVYGPSGKKK